jgi:aldehyde:ferredoxin oxidoreductase
MTQPSDLTQRETEPSTGKVERPDNERIIAAGATQGLLSNAATLRAFTTADLGDVDLVEAGLALKAQAAATNRGDLSAGTTLLSAQATTLNAIFADLARKAASCIGQNLEMADRCLRLAFKAQAQCRATVETLALIKGPPAVFARQANISHGTQQVNNVGLPPMTTARAGETEIPQNKLLRAGDVKRLDTGAQATTIAGNPTLATLGAFHGAEVGARQGDRRPKRRSGRDSVAIEGS